MNYTLFSPRMRMADVVAANHNLILMLPRFGLTLGFGNRTVRQLCEAHGIAPEFFVMVSNIYTFDDYFPDSADLNAVDMSQLVPYLQASHRYYLEERLPHMQHNLEAIADRVGESVGKALIAFFADYKRELTEHFDLEERELFPYIRRIQSGEHIEHKPVTFFSDSHSSIKDRLTDLMQILYKYLPDNAGDEQLAELVFDLLQLSKDIEKHSLIEERLLLPVEDCELSDREKEVLLYLSKGFRSKEIADQLCLSIHTVNTHRKNITQKTGIKSVAGLAVYAMLHNIS